MSLTPQRGQMVDYKLNQYDADAINQARDLRSPQHDSLAASGVRFHRGNRAEAGQVYPMLIVRCWGSGPNQAVNGQVFLDGNDVYWSTSCCQGEGEGQFVIPFYPVEEPRLAAPVSAGEA